MAQAGAVLILTQAREPVAPRLLHGHRPRPLPAPGGRRATPCMLEATVVRLRSKMGSLQGRGARRRPGGLRGADDLRARRSAGALTLLTRRAQSAPPAGPGPGPAVAGARPLEVRRLLAQGSGRGRSRPDASASTGTWCRCPQRRIDPRRERVTVDGRRVGDDTERIVLAAAQAGRATSPRAPIPDGRPTVYELLGDVGRWVFPVGRLDRDTSGLLVLTNDHRLGQRLTDPEHHVPKTYHVRVAGVPSSRGAARAARGSAARRRRDEPARLGCAASGSRRGGTWLEIVLTEGKNRQVRRMCAAVGHDVLDLVRVRDRAAWRSATCRPAAGGASTAADGRAARRSARDSIARPSSPRRTHDDHRSRSWLAAASAGAAAPTRQIRAAVEAMTPRLVETRRDIHMHPELGNRETRTGALVAERLRALGLEVRHPVAKTGVVGVLGGGRPGPVIAVRADLDALPIHERNDVPYKSRNDGVKHACGHDAHTTIVLGAAEVLAGLRQRAAGHGRLRLPARGGGAARRRGGRRALMIKEGVLDEPEGRRRSTACTWIRASTWATWAGRSVPSSRRSDRFVIEVARAQDARRLSAHRPRSGAGGGGAGAGAAARGLAADRRPGPEGADHRVHPRRQPLQHHRGPGHAGGHHPHAGRGRARGAQGAHRAHGRRSGGGARHHRRPALGRRRQRRPPSTRRRSPARRCPAWSACTAGRTCARCGRRWARRTSPPSRSGCRRSTSRWACATRRRASPP